MGGNLSSQLDLSTMPCVDPGRDDDVDGQRISTRSIRRRAVSTRSHSHND